MRIALPRFMLIAIVVGTLFPLWAVTGLSWAIMMIGSGFFFAMFDGHIVTGLIMVIWSTFAFYGLVTVIELLAHFWRTPHQNPSGKVLFRNTAGLAMGWACILIPVIEVLILGKSQTGLAGTLVGTIFIIPVSLAVSIWIFINRFRDKAANNSVENDARLSGTHISP